MIQQTSRNVLAFSLILATAWAGVSRADDWASKTYKVPGGGTLYLEYPLSWGKKPEFETFDEVADIRFGPFGPKSKPVLMVNLQSVKGADVQTDKDLTEIATVDVDALRASAFELDIPLNPISGDHVSGYYFTITDKESKYGEFDYLTMAVLGSGPLLTKVFFFSSDGAPDFSADAMRLMENLKYTAPPPKDKK